MKQYSATNIKNVALAGHSDEGKTTLAEAMLHVAGASDRLGRVADGNTVLDFDPEEKKRLASVSTACAPLEWRIDKINLIDTPGLFDFAGGVSEGLRAADTVLIVVSGKSGVAVGTEKAYKAATKKKKEKMFFVSHMDSEHADFKRTLDQLIENFGPTVCPILVPVVEDRKVKGYVNLLTEKMFTYNNGKITESEADLSAFEEYVTQLHEAVATTDEEMMEKFFSGEKFTQEEIIKGVYTAVKAGDIAPVYC
ncbi:MAG: GTP-binding protein, partial [Clostridia bacterium]|nr:GTP-binding protein [Clostridia bacterium]